MKILEDLNGKRVLITGSSRGIGKACAELFSELGCKIGIHFTSHEAAARQVQQSLQTEAAIFQADLATEDGCIKLIAAMKTTFGGMDILVVNHGIWEDGDIDKMTAENLRRTIDLNLNSLFYLTRESLPLFPGTGGSIVFVSSTAGQRGEAFHSHYAASKGGMISLTKSLAVELAPRKIRVNSVAPGWVMTDMTRDLLVGAYLKEIENTIPLRRIPEPEDIAPSVAFLASNMAVHITGEILNVNGGSVLCG
ncbi:MAG: SDR family NAD(P)-dependent oxidoreductase [Candidatus Zhuqueibacterota bacterium]